MFVEVSKITVAHLSEELSHLYKMLNQDLSPVQRLEVRNRVRTLRDILDDVMHAGFKEDVDE